MKKGRKRYEIPAQSPKCIDQGTRCFINVLSFVIRGRLGKEVQGLDKMLGLHKKRHHRTGWKDHPRLSIAKQGQFVSGPGLELREWTSQWEIRRTVIR